MNILLVIFVSVSFYHQFALGMTVNGVFSSKEARFNNGQHIALFCFYGMSDTLHIFKKRLRLQVGGITCEITIYNNLLWTMKYFTKLCKVCKDKQRRVLLSWYFWSNKLWWLLIWDEMNYLSVEYNIVQYQRCTFFKIFISALVKDSKD